MPYKGIAYRTYAVLCDTPQKSAIRLHPFMELNCGITSNDEKQVALLGILFYPHNNPNAYFIKQVEWNSDEYQRHQVGWGDDGGNKHDNKERVFTIVGK